MKENNDVLNNIQDNTEADYLKKKKKRRLTFLPQAFLCYKLLVVKRIFMFNFLGNAEHIRSILISSQKHIERHGKQAVHTCKMKIILVKQTKIIIY